MEKKVFVKENGKKKEKVSHIAFSFPFWDKKYKRYNPLYTLVGVR